MAHLRTCARLDTRLENTPTLLAARTDCILLKLKIINDEIMIDFAPGSEGKLDSILILSFLTDSPAKLRPRIN